MGVFIFRNDADYNGSTANGKIWNDLTAKLTEGLRGDGIPVVDLGKSIGTPSPGLAGIPPFMPGSEPDAAAHAAAARELMAFLEREKMLQ